MGRIDPTQPHDEPVDWLAEFESEPVALAEESRRGRESEPLFREVPLVPPAGQQSGPSSEVPRVERRLPRYQAAALALLRRRRKVLAATAAILVISTAATAGSLVMRRWQRSSEKVSDRQGDAANASSSTGAALFGASVAAAPAQMTAGDQLPPASATPAPEAPQFSPLAASTPQPRLSTDSLATKVRATPAPSGLPVDVSSTRPPGTGAATLTLLAAAPPTATPTGTPVAPAVTPAPTPAATPAPASAPTPTPTPVRTPATPAPSPEAADRTAVQGVLDRYRQTFDSLSVDDVATFWPSVNVRSLARAFDQLASQNVTFDGCTIELRGVQADATCRGKVRYVPKVGSRTAHVDAHQWTFLLERARAGWTITRVDVR